MLHNEEAASLGEIPQVEGSRILTFDRVHYASGPLASFASREGMIGWNEAFEKQFRVAKSDMSKFKTCGKLLQNHAGGEQNMESIRAAMQIVDAGGIAAFSARNVSGDEGAHDISVVVLPISFEFLGSSVQLLVGFQSVTKLNDHFETIKRLYNSSQGVAYDFLLRWAKAELMDFVRFHPVFTKLYSLMLNTVPSTLEALEQGSSLDDLRDVRDEVSEMEYAYWDTSGHPCYASAMEKLPSLASSMSSFSMSKGHGVCLSVASSKHWSRQASLDPDFAYSRLTS
jgi:hypothetical protein